jgi:hypothetical protein
MAHPEVVGLYTETQTTTKTMFKIVFCFSLLENWGPVTLLAPLPPELVSIKDKSRRRMTSKI